MIAHAFIPRPILNVPSVCDLQLEIDASGGSIASQTVFWKVDFHAIHTAFAKLSHQPIRKVLAHLLHYGVFGHLVLTIASSLDGIHHTLHGLPDCVRQGRIVRDAVDCMLDSALVKSVVWLVKKEPEQSV